MDIKALSQKDKEKYLGNVEYPADKDSVAISAEENEAPAELVERIRSLSADDEFSGPQDVLATLQGLPGVRVPK